MKRTEPTRVHTTTIEAMYRVSVIIAHTRATVARCLDGLAKQTIGHDAFEVLVIGANPDHIDSERYNFAIRYIECVDINPSERRNRGMSVARGELFAFVDDDAMPADDWLAVAVELFASRPQLVIAGGVTLFPDWADFRELLTYKLSHAGFFGNGHENLAEDCGGADRVLGYITSCNMIYAPHRAHLEDSFAVHVGYGGEDTLLVYEIARRQPAGVFYSTRLRVFHSRGPFGAAFLKTRFRYRLNNGLMLWVLPKIYIHNPKFAAGFLSACLIGLAGL
ncbi:MAG: glycosyltransferase family 2 protein, partial [Deltaproteobacteria bacterium]|nr:glycosyltransferase family 2 protein [Deltaproteobacteria bacterium]